MKYYRIELKFFIQDNITAEKTSFTYGEVVEASDEAEAVLEALNAVLPVQTEEYWPEEVSLYRVELLDLEEKTSKVPF